MRSWLARLRHDLVKRLLWPARDRRDAGGAVRPGELCPMLVDEAGTALSARDLWTRLRTEAPAGLDVGEFDRAIRAALAAADADDVEGVLELEGAFDELARLVEGSGKGKP